MSEDIVKLGEIGQFIRGVALQSQTLFLRTGTPVSAMPKFIPSMGSNSRPYPWSQTTVLHRLSGCKRATSFFQRLVKLRLKLAKQRHL